MMASKKRSIRRGLLAAPLTWLLGWTVFAHQVPWAKITSLTLTEAGVQLRIEYAITDPQMALDLRERFDGNADRVLSPDEQESLQRYLIDEALRPLRVWLDGAAQPLDILRVRAGGLGDRLPSSYPITLTIHLQSKLKIEGQFHTIRISDFDARVQAESICAVTFPKTFRFEVAARPEVVVSGATVWRVFTGEDQDLIIDFTR